MKPKDIKKIKLKEIYSGYTARKDRAVEVIIKSNLSTRYWDVDNMEKVQKLVEKINSIVLKMKKLNIPANWVPTVFEEEK